MNPLPLLIEAEQLNTHLDEAQLLLVDMGDFDVYSEAHIPGAINLCYSEIVRVVPPAGGLLPSAAELSDILSAIGLTPDKQVVAYDAEQGGRAARLLWTLDVLGHSKLSLLNGGLSAWKNAGLALKAGVEKPTPSSYQARISNPEALADKDYILSRLGQDDLAIFDARSPAEYAGLDVRAARGGHIPGAVNLNWLDCIDNANALRFKPDSELRTLLEQRGLQKDKEIIVHCQTHHRSSHSYWVLKHLGYPRIRGYAGSWSEWGNTADTPIETSD
jgi:thiosulfate/3-mercaptopyruvate sulfurtransferase